jgi:hypothetical protein
MGVTKLMLYLDTSFLKGDGVVKVQAGPLIGPAGLLTPRGWLALSGTSDSAVFAEDPKRPRTIFTESLVAGLRGHRRHDRLGRQRRASSAPLHLFVRDVSAGAATFEPPHYSKAATVPCGAAGAASRDRAG